MTGTGTWRNWLLPPPALPWLARHTVATLLARQGLSRRCIVLDLDNTLWGGVVGDDGLSGLVIGHGVDGEAYLDFQRYLKALNERGVLLAVCSKNDRSTAEQPFRRHPDMLLSLGDISTFVANWESKSSNIRQIAETLSLGLESLVFIDDNPMERAEVRQILPQVDVLPLPEDVSGYRSALEQYPFLEPATFTAEDQARAGQYRARAAAEELRNSSRSVDEFQKSLQMQATVGPIDDANISRVVQLINKTNQFNLTTRRRTMAELESLIRDSHVTHFWIRLKDRFADHGLIAVAIAVTNGNTLEVDTLLMSCRVMGRGLEWVIRDILIEKAHRLGCDDILGVYRPTERNRPVETLWAQLGFTQCRNQASHDGTVWRLSLAEIPPASVPIEVTTLSHNNEVSQ